MSRKAKRKLAVIDFETDPFVFGRTPKPFAAGFFDGTDYVNFWGDNCAERLMDFLGGYSEPLLIYAHNGGKFDFYFLLEHGALENPVKIINGRIAKAKMGAHELRDSFSILPIPLGAWNKDSIDYDKFEADVRDKHKPEILKYLESDCRYLYDMVFQFRTRFGDNLTIGGTAIKKLLEFHPFWRGGESHDKRMRRFYFGGRVQFFERGIISGDFKCVDVNSMYPYVMANYRHPTGNSYFNVKASWKDFSRDGVYMPAPNRPFYFIHFTGKNRGALPVRLKDGLSFEQDYGEFYTTSHELKVAMKYGLVEIDTVHEMLIPSQTIQFDEFVNTYTKEKIEGKQTGNKAQELFAKLLQNSSYGKTAQNPDNYYDYKIVYPDQPFPEGEHDLYLDYGGVQIWRKKSVSRQYYDVAIGASITSAARSVLLEALQRVKRPVYCDTDSIICEDYGDIKIHPTELGAWDLEKSSNRVVIAGKKLYAMYNELECGEKVTQKIATKGVRINLHELIDVANGKTIIHKNNAPCFKLTGEVKFTERRVRML